MKSILLCMFLLLPMTYFSARAQTAFPTANGSIAQGVANLCVNSSGVAAPCPSATAPGTSSTAAQPIQGVTGGVPVPVSGTFSASFSGFTAATTGTPIAVTTSGVTGTLPSGTVVVATNTGSTNGAYCALGASATTSSQYIPPGGGWFAFTVGSATQLTCITSTSTTTVNLTGGAGLPTGAGGTGSGGGGGGGNVNLTQLNTVNLGSPSNYGTSPGAVEVQGVNAYVTNTVPENLSQVGGATVNLGQTTMSGSIPVVLPSNQSSIPVSGTFFQSTQPVSITGNQAVNTAQVNGITTLTGAGATGTGSQRETVAQDTTTIAGSAPGTAGTASANVLTVQGVTSMTPVQVSQATAANLNATVVGTGTFAVQSAETLGTTNGWTPLLVNNQSTTVKAVKSSAGQLGMLQCYNPNSSQVYVQVFNIASGSVTLGTSTPTLSIPIAPTATGGYALSNPGINFSTAMSLAVTTTATGSTAPSTAADCNVAYN